MGQKYEVFVGDFHLKLMKNQEEKPTNSQSVSTHESALQLLDKAFHNELNGKYLYFVQDCEAALELLLKSYKHIEAAGGIVSNENHEYLAIKRLGVWDLPKGKIESGEAVAEAAVREVEEECGVTNLNLQRFISRTFHGYIMKGKKILKTTHWFEMSTEFQSELTPQLEEDITEVEWMTKQDFRDNLEASYPTITLLVRDYFDQ